MHKFRRQHPISTFIADFYSHKLKLVIEIDGGYHLNNAQKEYDDFRDEDMNGMCISVIRFTNEEVIKHSETVLQRIIEKIKVLENPSRITNHI
jgi:very-short-patch-repair endonuclease